MGKRHSIQVTFDIHQHKLSCCLQAFAERARLGQAMQWAALGLCLSPDRWKEADLSSLLTTASLMPSTHLQ